MRKIPIFLLTMLLILFYITAFLNLPFAFIMSFYGLVYIGPVLSASAVIWWILPQQRKDKFVNNKIKYYLFVTVTVLIVFLALFPGRKVITSYYFANSSMAIRIFAKIMLLLLLLFVTGNLLKNKRLKTSIVCIVSYIVFVIIGFLGPAFTNNSATSDASSKIQSLATLPYLSWGPLGDSENKSSVTIYDPSLSYKGINMYTSLYESYTFLFDMQGNILHKWTLDTTIDNKGCHSKLLENGDLLCMLATKEELKKLDWNSNEIWKLNIPGHHEIALKDNNEIYILAWRDRIVFFKGLPIPILSDYIAVISQDGKILREISIYDSIKEHLPLGIAHRIYRWLANPINIFDIITRQIKNKNIFNESTVLDILHNNRISIADKDITDTCKKSDILLSFRELSFIAIMDIDIEKFIWTWGKGQLSRQHHPTFLENDNIMVFDNGVKRGFSRIIEVNPKTNTIEWDYVADPPENFFSNIRGSCQKLPNGNVLITESVRGRIFEITPSGQIVWEYYNTHINKKKKERAGFYRVERIVDTHLSQNIEKLLEANQN